MSRRRLPPVVGVATVLSGLAFVPAAEAGCGGWDCQPGCGAPAWGAPPAVYAPAMPCGVLMYLPQPAYRVEQGPIYNVVVVPYDPPRLRFSYGRPRFFADCACYR